MTTSSIVDCPGKVKKKVQKESNDPEKKMPWTDTFYIDALFCFFYLNYLTSFIHAAAEAYSMGQFRLATIWTNVGICRLESSPIGVSRSSPRFGMSSFWAYHFLSSSLKRSFPTLAAIACLTAPIECRYPGLGSYRFPHSKGLRNRDITRGSPLGRQVSWECSPG